MDEGQTHRPHFSISPRKTQKLPIAPSLPRVIPGKTMKLCPGCNKKRRRKSHVYGPYTEDQLPIGTKELKSHRSDNLFWIWFWRCTLLWWLVLPPTSRNGKVWYMMHFFAICDTPGCIGAVRIEEREGARRLSRLKRFENLIRHYFNDGVERIWPVE
jgi:hypothetical protein